MITIKRIYEPRELTDGTRVLVDRLWPRGIKKETAGIDLWAKAIAPSTELRQWYAHRFVRWQEFQIRYKSELADVEAREELARLRMAGRSGNVTLLTATSNEKQSHAVVLQQLLDA